MEFTVSKKAKNLTLALMGSGLLLTVIGLVMSMGDHHFKTRLLTNGLINSFYFFGIALGALFFLALQYATETGWYASVKRIIEAVAGFLPYGAGLLAVVLIVITLMDGAHIYQWMDPSTTDPSSHHYDKIIDGKSAYLNKVFFWIRTVVYLAVYLMYWRGFRNRSLEEDRIGGTEIHFKNYKKAAVFLVFFAVFSSTSSWDWLMSIDVHWFSTLYGWYVFSGIWVSAMVVIVLLTLYLKKLGYLPNVNDSHIHDLGKWAFAISFLWSYLWFSQYMLIWYTNFPEETLYFTKRLQGYPVMFYLIIVVNFILPFLVLIKRESKRAINTTIVMAIIIIIGHWLDYFTVVVPELVPTGGFGLIGIGAFIMMGSVFTFTMLNALSKVKDLESSTHPFVRESYQHHI